MAVPIEPTTSPEATALAAHNVAMRALADLAEIDAHLARHGLERAEHPSEGYYLSIHLKGWLKRRMVLVRPLGSWHSLERLKDLSRQGSTIAP